MGPKRTTTSTLSGRDIGKELDDEPGKNGLVVHANLNALRLMMGESPSGETNWKDGTIEGQRHLNAIQQFANRVQELPTLLTDQVTAQVLEGLRDLILGLTNEQATDWPGQGCGQILEYLIVRAKTALLSAAFAEVASSEVQIAIPSLWFPIFATLLSPELPMPALEKRKIIFQIFSFLSCLFASFPQTAKAFLRGATPFPATDVGAWCKESRTLVHCEVLMEVITTLRKPATTTNSDFGDSIGLPLNDCVWLKLLLNDETQYWKAVLSFAKSRSPILMDYRVEWIQHDGKKIHMVVDKVVFDERGLSWMANVDSLALVFDIYLRGKEVHVSKQCALEFKIAECDTTTSLQQIPSSVKIQFALRDYQRLVTLLRTKCATVIPC